MTHSDAFASMKPDELGRLLLRAARRDRAPDGARERTLSRVASLTLGAAAMTGARASWGAPVVTKSAGILAAKWLALGLGVSLLGLSAVDRLQPASAPFVTQAKAPAVRAASPAPRPAASDQAAAPVVMPAAAAGPAASTAGLLRLKAYPSATVSTAPDRAGSTRDLTDTSQLAREVLALRQARAGLAGGNTVLARERLLDYQREFPAGMLATEAAALQVEVAFACHSSGAPALAEAFLRDHAMSPLTRRIQNLLEGAPAPNSKP
jgi:hypothetical protein